MIEIKHLKKEYEIITPLNDVNTVINKGDIIAVIGPSGTGKSTLLRCINRLEEPTSGEILIDGESITNSKCNLNKIRRKLGMVFQSFNLYEHLTVVENCMLAQTVIIKRTRQEAYKKAMEILKSVGMEKSALQYPEQLSGGQKQRVAIARTLCTDPEIILFDEPTSALDPLMITEVEEVIANLANQGRTMMIVTHSMEFARKVSNRIFYMDQGGIYEDGTPEQIFDNPKNERTRRFVRRLSCLEMEITSKNHNLEEEFGKIYSFANDNCLSAECTINAIKCYEEFVSLMIRTIHPDNPTFLVSLEYFNEKDILSMSFTEYTESEIPFDSEEVKNSLEYKIISHYIKDYRVESSDSGIGYRHTVEL